MAKTAAGKTGTDDLESFVSYRLARLNAVLYADLAHELQAHVDLSPVQWRIIALLHRHAPTTSAELVRESGMDAGLLSRNLKRLVDERLVDAAHSDDDRRRLRLSLTRRGRRLYERLIPLMRRRQTRLMRGIDERERRVLYRALDKLRDNALG